MFQNILEWNKPVVFQHIISWKSSQIFRDETIKKCQSFYQYQAVSPWGQEIKRQIKRRKINEMEESSFIQMKLDTGTRDFIQEREKKKTCKE